MKTKVAESIQEGTGSDRQGLANTKQGRVSEAKGSQESIGKSKAVAGEQEGRQEMQEPAGSRGGQERGGEM
jgi:hypothetical protein